MVPTCDFSFAFPDQVYTNYTFRIEVLFPSVPKTNSNVPHKYLAIKTNQWTDVLAVLSKNFSSSKGYQLN